MAIAIQTALSFLPAALVICVNREAIDTAAVSGAIKGEVTLSTQLLLQTKLRNQLPSSSLRSDFQSGPSVIGNCLANSSQRLP